MTTYNRLTLAAAALIASFGVANAQSAQDHDAHHPADTGAAPGQRPPMAPTARPGGMPMKPGGQGMGMGGDAMHAMHPMHGDMHGMGMGPGDMHGFGHVEGRLAFVKAELKIADAQTAQWNAFADAVRATAAAQRTAMQGTAHATGPATVPETMGRRIAAVTAHLDGMKTVLAAVKPLYAVLSDDQKKVADELMAEHAMMH